MTPLGHLSAAYLAGDASERVSTPAALVGGVLPDVDFLLIVTPWFNQLHRVVTHNLLFVALFTALGTLSAPKRGRKAVAVGLLIGGLLHLLIDASLDSNPTNGLGVALWWPFFDDVVSPFNLWDVLPLEPATPGWSQPLRQLWASAPGLLVELPFVAAATRRLLRNRHRSAQA
jgi:membrane-bound metal-dependent hydrolase YbcI (DUF457 family)